MKMKRSSSLFPFSAWPYLLMFVYLFTSLHTHLVSSQCLPDQKNLLLEFKTNLTFDPYGSSDKLAGWNERRDCCQWNGVECNNSSGRVTGLDLSYKDIVGGINDSSNLFRLQFLERLNLTGNVYIEGEIPSAFGKLTRLTHLSLAGFGGQVPIEISHLANLIVLHISSGIYVLGNPLHMKKPNLATMVKNLTNIRELYLDGVDNSAMGDKWGSALSSYLPHLQVLTMTSCNLRGEIHQSLSKLHHLSVINLHSNLLLTGQIPESFANFANLTTLILSRCAFFGVVTENIFQVGTLTVLDLSENEKLQGSFPVFLQNGSLEELSLRLTNFSGILPSSISNLKRLRSIDLSYCKFHGSIPSSITSLNLLKYVKLSDNRFSGPIPSFSSAKSLVILDLSSNNLNGSVISTDWGKLVHLLELDLSHNLLEGSIPMSLFMLPSISHIDLNENKFSGQLDEFASSASNVLSYLDLSKNKLEGRIPKSIFLLRGLMNLDLSSNRFNGTLMMRKLLENLNNLRDLSFSHNLLSIDTSGCGVNTSIPQLYILRLASCNLRVIPEFLKNQSSLSSLDLSMNQISGTVPNWMGRIIHSLEDMNISCNYFENIEPAFLGQFNVSYVFSSLDLHSNCFKGQFPLVLFKHLDYLDCSNNFYTSINFGNYVSRPMFLSFARNNLFGSIPKALCNDTQLQLLNLELNHLDGTIPACLINMIGLSALNLRNNNLRGAIPAKFGKGCSLQTLDLNENFLRGKIPRSIVNCEKIRVLDLGNNEFNDKFPCHLKKLPNLQVLILRSNKFHGNLECREPHSTWLMLQIVDLASNHFSGELRSQILIKSIAMMEEVSRGQSQLRYLQFKAAWYYYQNTLALTFKGYSYELQYVLTIFAGIDFSNNNFHGELPSELGNLNALVVLNLSHNYFSGNIPPSLGNLSNIESLDLSCNALTGIIPPTFASLNFLTYLNLSFNKLSGKIPTSTQLQSFDTSSYEGNQGLYGPPLTPISRIKAHPRSTPSTSLQDSHWSSKKQIEWMVKGAEVGFPVGIMVLIGPLLYIKRFREWYCKHLHRFVMKILRKEDPVRRRRRRRQQKQRS